MAKVKSVAHLQAALDSELGWRISELSNLRAAIFASEGLRRSVLLRASVPIAYAHWEGFIKNSASLYGTYLSSIGLFYKDVKPCFSGLGLMNLVQSAGTIRRKFAAASDILVKIQNFDNAPVLIRMWPVFEDVGNLNFELFQEIALFLNIDITPYKTKQVFIDTSLLSRRNKIAHGENLDVDEQAVRTTFDEVIGIIRLFKSHIENDVSVKAYRR